MIVAVLVCEKLIPNVAEPLQGAAPAPLIEKLDNNIKSKSFSTELRHLSCFKRPKIAKFELP